MHLLINVYCATRQHHTAYIKASL